MKTVNITEIEPSVRDVLTSRGYSERRICDIIVVVHKIIRLHKEQSIEHFDADVIANHIRSYEIRCQNGEIGKAALEAHKSMVNYIVQICETGTISDKRRSPISELPDGFNCILSDILGNTDGWNSKTCREYYNHARTFFRWLNEQGHVNLNHVSVETVRSYLVHCSKKMTGGSLTNTRRAMKDVLTFVSEDGILPVEMQRLFLFSIPISKKVQPFIAQDDIAAVLNVIDRTTAVGKRDYAMILLSAVTGLRGIDVRGLSLSAIEWGFGEIRIIQEKTGNALALPLTTDVGKAIREYIENGRPKSSSDKVFLSALAPFGELRRGTPSSMLGRYCVKAGLARKWGFHSLRRSIATNMVIAGVSVITVAQELGQRSINSTKQYISLDSENLKECALDFNGIRTGGCK